ncbi:MAG: glycosyltransferase family 2 protein [Deltaproteobacteria bacterium]|nr:glycosyltransferase family 2 protein [Deltaproteobacteria bacterium]
MNKNLAPINLLSVVIPARDEEGSIRSTIELISDRLTEKNIAHELIVVDDGSSDQTWSILTDMKNNWPSLHPVQNAGEHGFGRAVIYGLNHMLGDAVAIMMADASDDVEDLIKYYEKLNEGYECVFGSRFIKGGTVYDYPTVKYILNRMANTFISLLFGLRFNDTTNAFKAYRSSVINGCRPLISPHFNLTVELPLKAIVRGYSWTTLPISWRNRTAGEAKLKIKEMGSRYLFICLYVWLEKYFSRGDYKRRA